MEIVFGILFAVACIVVLALNLVRIEKNQRIEYMTRGWDDSNRALRKAQDQRTELKGTIIDLRDTMALYKLNLEKGSDSLRRYSECNDRMGKRLEEYRAREVRRRERIQNVLRESLEDRKRRVRAEHALSELWVAFQEKCDEYDRLDADATELAEGIVEVCNEVSKSEAEARALEHVVATLCDEIDVLRRHLNPELCKDSKPTPRRPKSAGA